MIEAGETQSAAMMKCPQCKTEQDSADTCVTCGIVFAKYWEVQERKKKEQKEATFASLPPPSKDNRDGLLFYSGLAVFIVSVSARVHFAPQFPSSLDIYFRLLMLATMGWLAFWIVPRMAAFLKRFEKDRGSEGQGLQGFSLYHKKAIFIFFALGAVMLYFLAGALLSGSVECFAGRNRTCHEIYDSINEPGAYWISTMIHYGVSLFTVTIGYMGVLLRRGRE
ncbi:MAG: hypothetical protein G3M78_01795 [Candidatus Nitrohelix vancouverensis]|uniref:Uncharacterized protein n=1 Tax=Candidatus Nitrohelix vancouverensis TaxID=2705534 RepID=A0A7T0C0D5_9BACT|nr:MAG: hypothetical protein G3M78_01795 [Candidatus Nitrohelix vancouverensis]